MWRRLSVLAFAGAGIVGCGESATTATPGSAPDFTYAMENPLTGQTTNAILLTYPGDSKYQVRFSGDGLSSEAPMDVFVPLQERFEFDYASEGTLSLAMDVVRGDGTPYLGDTLSWVYNTEVPDPPVVSFSEAATSDTGVTMLIAGNRSADTQEIWVEGDLGGKHADGGFWDKLSDSGIYLLEVSPSDGVKTMTVKLRNVYGNESEPVVASILKKSDAPTGCTVEMAGAGAAKSSVQLKLYAHTAGPMFYAVLGDVDPVNDFKAFNSGDSVTVALSGGTGTKQLIIKMRDLANNYCDDIVQTIDVEGEYVPQTLAVHGNPLWATTGSVMLDLRYDHYASQEPVEMRLTGDIIGANVNQWLPFAANPTVTFMPGSGEKKIFAQFRDHDATESFLVSAQVFYDPGLTVTDAGGGVKSIVVSDPPGLTDVTISGCAEALSHKAWQTSFSCTPNAADASALYTFTDGTTLTKTTPF